MDQTELANQNPTGYALGELARLLHEGVVFDFDGSVSSASLTSITKLSEFALFSVCRHSYALSPRIFGFLRVCGYAR